jgi:hypothetical protein
MGGNLRRQAFFVSERGWKTLYRMRKKIFEEMLFASA